MWIGILNTSVTVPSLPGQGNPGPPAPTTYNVLAQNDDTLILENGDNMVTEEAP